MDFSKPEPEYISYDLRHLIDDLLFSLRIHQRFKLAQFTVDLEDELPNVECDVGQIQQVLMNLLNNAADAIDQKAEEFASSGQEMERRIGISAAYESDREQVVVEISDNGIGMSEETQEKIFSLHFTTKKGGHGLGLYNCQKIVESHGGQLKVSSVLSEGTRFTMVLPRFQPETDSPE
jgi:signal transduction histidine kinase